MRTFRVIPFLCVLFVIGCWEMRTVVQKKFVEIAPGRWLEVTLENTVHASDTKKDIVNPHALEPSDVEDQLSQKPLKDANFATESTRISFLWNGKWVIWQGSEIPVSLREHEGELFLIGFNREEAHRQRLGLAFFAFNQEKTGFERIRPGSFPREIATQNMWLNADTRYMGTDDGKIDKWELLRKLDFKNKYFAKSLTARIWYQIDNDSEEYTHGARVPMEAIQEYAERFQPIALPTIVKDD